MRNYKKIKTLDDYRVLDAPSIVNIGKHQPIPDTTSQMILRMLVRAKYGPFEIPACLWWLKPFIFALSSKDENYTDILESWCYVTVRHGMPFSTTDDEWHFDGASFRMDDIPDRNYIWVNHTPTEYKTGIMYIPEGFDPIRNNLFTLAINNTRINRIHATVARNWYMFNPFVLHRRPPNTPNKPRTFIRISFTDVEIRDVNNTQNPMLPTEAFGRDPVKSFRNQLTDYVPTH